MILLGLVILIAIGGGFLAWPYLFAFWKPFRDSEIQSLKNAQRDAKKVYRHRHFVLTGYLVFLLIVFCVALYFSKGQLFYD